MVDSEPGPGSSESGHHLIDDQKDAVSATDLGDRWPIVLGWYRGTEGGAPHRLGNEGRDIPSSDDLLLQPGGVPDAAGRRMIRSGAPVLVHRRQVSGST